MGELSTVLFTLLLGITPISELRGAIPYAFFNGIPLVTSALLGCLSNLLVYPLVSFFLNIFHSFFYARIGFYRRFFDHTIARIRHKVESKVTLYGMVGVTLFVAIPFPVTGAYSGTLGSWVLGLDKRKSFLAVSIGVLISTIIVTVVLFLGNGAYSIWIKQV
ncbi:MAG: small multi-drug export protein [Sphaerochaetaceae bacterium]|nr:small multi-drug export protein [Sphaerochaetaceae bacterium]MDC7248171.1 small multi-drug export protein [Sphaerochaetaceae bacterium]